MVVLVASLTSLCLASKLLPSRVECRVENNKRCHAQLGTPRLVPRETTAGNTIHQLCSENGLTGHVFCSRTRRNKGRVYTMGKRASRVQRVHAAGAGDDSLWCRPNRLVENRDRFIEGEPPVMDPPAIECWSGSRVECEGECDKKSNVGVHWKLKLFSDQHAEEETKRGICERLTESETVNWPG